MFYEAFLAIPSPSDWAPAVGAAAIAGTAAVASTVAATIRGPRERRRALYSDAFRDALAWQECLYRIRRRDNSAEQQNDLIERMHDLQERINHHRAWLASESVYLARSYCTLVDHVKRECLPLISSAWQTPGQAPSSATHGIKAHPRDINAAASRFLTDVRLHLRSSLVIPSIVLYFRNRK
ncbi:hypothetical protein Q5424_05795 [Conexibacter sp. JD483]|uniref:hypothetical protein n=1 Tax=unclassified Conexibacter TaxID=2627773 RepID=UPI00271CB6C4|nr:MULTISPECIES: hypothetical protein [unclassified Conexibacter]MDO8185973.1 hypothetical protein [Conexibacter sp. CPCC 205706]MDO8199464.1 hypothetical protein [Conexibacter sp. CPCC 205762]MDR9368582.1 hypothetical protein [Conexibacter sp. JD483]